MLTLYLAGGATLITGFVVGLGVALVYPFIGSRLSRRQPQRRANALLGWAVAPIGVGLFFSALLFIPVLLKYLGISTGHCHNHAERLPHICLSNPLVSGSETLPWYLVVALTAILSTILVSQCAHIFKILRLKAALRRASSEGGTEYNMVFWNKPAALTVGFRVPEIFISGTLAKALSPEHFHVILAHEKAHVLRRDPLRQFIGVALSFLHLPRVRRRILNDLSLAIEQTCDEEAARKTGDRLLVAETILAVERLLKTLRPAVSPMAVGFTNGNSARRIEALLTDQEYEEPSLPGWCLISQPVAVAAWVMPGPVHYITELFIGH